jgi:hypothetical protein
VPVLAVEPLGITATVVRAEVKQLREPRERVVLAEVVDRLTPPAAEVVVELAIWEVGQTAPVVVLPERVDNAEVLPRGLLPAAQQQLVRELPVVYTAVVAAGAMTQPMLVEMVEMVVFD